MAVVAISCWKIKFSPQLRQLSLLCSQLSSDQLRLCTEFISFYYIIIQSHFSSSELTKINYLNAPFSSDCHEHEKSFPLLAAAEVPTKTLNFLQTDIFVSVKVIYLICEWSRECRCNMYYGFRMRAQKRSLATMYNDLSPYTCRPDRYVRLSVTV